jgi:hypothetical protein
VLTYPTLHSIIGKALIVERSRLEYAWRSAEARRSALTRQDARVHPRGRGLVTHRATSHHRGTTLPSRSSRTKLTQEGVKDQAETTTASSRQSYGDLLQLPSGWTQVVRVPATSATRHRPSHMHREDSHPVPSKGPHSRQLPEGA